MSSSSSAGYLLAPAGSSGLVSIGSGNSASSSCAVANAFADAFLAALATGNTKWGSDAAVAQLLHDTAKMVGMDKQLYVGKTAIIRRLNSGMDQLVKMVAANAVDSGSSSNAAAAAAELASSMPKPQLSVMCPDPKAKPSLVVAQYTFKWGLRKFTLRDEFLVKNGQIMRLRRSRG
jgi:aldehyde:ferredoxin oxidoreductase